MFTGSELRRGAASDVADRAVLPALAHAYAFALVAARADDGTDAGDTALPRPTDGAAAAAAGDALRSGAAAVAGGRPYRTSVGITRVAEGFSMGLPRYSLCLLLTWLRACAMSLSTSSLPLSAICSTVRRPYAFAKNSSLSLAGGDVISVVFACSTDVFVSC